MRIDTLSKQDLNITKDERSSKTHHHFTIRLGSSDFYAAVDEQLQHHQKSASIKGFRPGKVPLPVIKQHYQNSSEQEILRTVLSRAVDIILTDNNLHPLVTPQIKAVPPQREKDMTASITILTAYIPDIDYSTVTIKRYRAQPSESDIDNALVQLKQLYKRFTPIAEARPPKDGERVVLRYTLTPQDKSKEQKGSWNVDMVPLQQAASPLHRALIQALARYKKGETFTVETHIDPEKTQSVHINATIDEISQGSPLSEQDMLTTFKVKDQQELRNTMRQELQKQADDLSEQSTRKELWQALSRTVSIDLPDEYLQLARPANTDSETEKTPVDTDSLRLYALSRHIATQNHLFPTQQAIEPQMQALLKAIDNDKNQDKSLTAEDRDNLYHRLHASMTQKNVDAFLLTKVRVQDHTVPFNQLFDKDASSKAASNDKKSSLIT